MTFSVSSGTQIEKAREIRTVYYESLLAKGIEETHRSLSIGGVCLAVRETKSPFDKIKLQAFILSASDSSTLKTNAEDVLKSYDYIINSPETQLHASLLNDFYTFPPDISVEGVLMISEKSFNVSRLFLPVMEDTVDYMRFLEGYYYSEIEFRGIEEVHKKLWLPEVSLAIKAGEGADEKNCRENINIVIPAYALSLDQISKHFTIS